MNQFIPIIDHIRALAAAQKRSVVLPESEDPRILAAAVAVKNLGLAEPILLGDVEVLTSLANDLGLDLSGMSILAIEPLLQSTVLSLYLQSRKHFTNLTSAQIKTALSDPLTLACCMLATKQVDACVAGAANTTASVIQKGLRIIGMLPETPLLSSFFLMVFASPPAPNLHYALFADCAINVNPNAEQLTRIAMATTRSAEKLFQFEPRVAMLSFSTASSAVHEDVDKIKDATDILIKQHTDLKILGEVQFDAALLPSVRQSKFVDAGYDEPANIFVFPNLDAANIGYKIAERLGGALPVGPILQGLQKPLNDLSRGTDVEAIINTIAITCLQVEDE